MSLFDAGERALFIDRKGRRYLVTLKAGLQFHTHDGYVEPDTVIGSPEGARVFSSTGVPFVVVRPSLTDFVLKMPRGAQVIYPKDIAAIVMSADVFPGAVVLEAGTGSGALTLGLLRAVGDHGRVVTYEARQDFAERARANIESFLGKIPDALDMRLGDVTEPGPIDSVDPIVLDPPEPWRARPRALEIPQPRGGPCM